MNSPNSSTTRNLAWSILASLALLALTYASMVLFLQSFPSKAVDRLPSPVRDYDSSALQDRVTPAAVSVYQQRILDHGSRYPGADGFASVQQDLKNFMIARGLEVRSMTQELVAPVTKTRILSVWNSTSQSFRPAPAAEVFPFYPNHMQPAVTPIEGLDGELFLVGESSMRESTSFRNKIALVDLSDFWVESELGYDWKAYASLGFSAVIVSHPQGLSAVNWPAVAENGKMIGGLPVNFVRLAASPDIFQLAGQRIRLQVRVEYETVEAETLIGMLRAEAPVQEALVVVVPYDTPSPLPDLSHGGIQAINTAFVMRLIEGLALYRSSLRRDIIFYFHGSSAIAEEAVRTLVRFLGLSPGNVEGGNFTPGLVERRKQPFMERFEENRSRLQILSSLQGRFNDPAFLQQAQATGEAIASLDETARELLDQQVAHVLRTVVLERREPYLAARIEVERSEVLDPEDPRLQVYSEARIPFEEARSASGFSLVNLLQSKSEYVEEIDFRQRVAQRLDELHAFHLRNQQWLQEGFDLIELISAYRNVGYLDFTFAPPKVASEENESLTLSTGREVIQVEAFGIANLMTMSRVDLDIPNTALEIPELVVDQRSQVEWRNLSGHLIWTPRILSSNGYPIYRFLNDGRIQAYRERFNPTVLPFMKELEGLQSALAVAAETVLSMAHGNGQLNPFPPYTVAANDLGGTVLASNIGATVVPDYQLPGALVGGPPMTTNNIGFGYHDFPFVKTDPYGRFWRPQETGDFANFDSVWPRGDIVSLAVAWIGPDGLIQYIKDEGDEAQRMFRSANIYWRDRAALRHSNYIVFRGTPVALFDTIDPQSLQAFKAVKFLEARGLSDLQKQYYIENRIPGIETIFVEPDQRVSVLLQAGTLESEQVVETRSFLLGYDDPAPAESEIGPGYLAADTPFLLDVPSEAATSMLAVNSARIQLQREHNMTDELTENYHQQAQDFYKESQQPDLAHRQQSQAARQSMVYSMLTHPVLKESLWEAVIGILWYLGLLVPFIFFFEKLVFGFPDARRQVIAQSIIFLLVFASLRLLHPAFLMVRSSLMILIGFIILLITVGMTLLFSGKFSQNLEELRKRQGKLTSAEANTMGVMGTSFLLGLNNMHRRRLRTGLTCATLTLLTFVMISFTSIQTDIVDESEPIGKAPYQGMLLKKEMFERYNSAEIQAVRQKYGDDYRVLPRGAILGTEDARTRQPLLPDIRIERFTGSQPDSAKLGAELRSLLFLSPGDPLSRHLDFVTDPYWFTEDATTGGDPSIILPLSVARELGIDPQDIGPQGLPVVLNDLTYRVRAIFDERSLETYRDLDGLDILPYDILSLGNYVRLSPTNILAPDDAPRVDASQLAIVQHGPNDLTFNDGVYVDLALAIDMSEANFAQANNSIRQYMDQSGQYVHYGLKDTAYRGRRAREASLEGMIDMVIPLILGGLVVLNTMKGSVYERQGEIYVYNSVGIAPRYVFLMFMAEAFVYAVVGAVLGYLLSQGTGRALTALELTGGLNMTYASLTSIYASLAVMAAVFLSTLYPARQAMKIAAPAEEAGWSIPEPQGDTIAFDLPFNFRHQGRLAALEFVFRLMEDHGEGGSGRFFSSPPQLRFHHPTSSPVAEDPRSSDPSPPVAEDPRSSDLPLPELACRVWIKPYDLGVSQDVRITMAEDPATGLYKATVTLTRRSGTRDAWTSLNSVFVARLRKHFLHWRAVPPQDRQDLFHIAKAKLEQAIPKEPAATT